MICLHYQSKFEFFINPDFIESMEWLPAEKQTVVFVVGRPSGYKCIETPDQIRVMIEQTSTQRIPLDGGVGGQGPVYGDGTEMEQRGGVVTGASGYRSDGGYSSAGYRRGPGVPAGGTADYGGAALGPPWGGG